MSEVREFRDLAPGAFLHIPDNPNGEALVLTHGAGSNSQAPLLVAVAEAFAGSGCLVLRYDLPFRRNRRSGPPFPAQAAEDRAGLRTAVLALGKETSGPIFLGGHSYGGRQASMLAAEEPGRVAKLLLLSYPLHPPNKPGQLRTDHFPHLRTPVAFVHGSKDPFASPEELRAALEIVPAPTSLVIVERAGHDLARGKFDVSHLAIHPLRNLPLLISD
jgi:predicted alpha/beta-hydrolase family hydrolase